MANNKDAIQVGLSHEELFVILRYLKVEKMIGFDQDVMDNLEEEKRLLIYSAAERSLFARSFLQRNKANQMMVNPIVFALVGACVAPEISAILLRAVPSNMEEQYFFHISRKMNVLHTIPVMTFHQFSALEEKLNLAQAFFSILNLIDHPRAELPAGEIQMSVLSEAREAAMKNGTDASRDILTVAGLAKDTSSALANTLVDPIANNTISFIDHETNQMDGYAILQGRNGNWLLTPTKLEGEETVKISIITVEGIVNQVKSGFKL